MAEGMAEDVMQTGKRACVIGRWCQKRVFLLFFPFQPFTPSLLIHFLPCFTLNEKKELTWYVYSH